MKIKEVIKKTELTDRAIRLYIDEGLVKPNIEESYSGRKNIDFSDDDVKRLNNVALLRKAGFSIADIKSIIENNGTAKEIIKKFIEQTEQTIRQNTLVVEKLKSISFDEEISLETICNSLSETVKETAVPKEDLKPTPISEAIRKFCFCLGIFGMVISVCAIVAYFVICKIEFTHLYLKSFLGIVFLFANCCAIAVFVLSLIIALLNRKSKINKIKDGVKRTVSFALVLALVPLSIFSPLPYAFGFLLPHSTTYDIEDYLILDSWVEQECGKEIYAVFPSEVPKSAIESPYISFNIGLPLTTKYYYDYSYTFDPEFNIIAEWILPEKEYELAKSGISAPAKLTQRRGEWVFNYYADTQEPELWEDAHYWFLIFAYNDNTRQVRYIACYSIDAPPEGPYYLSLDW